MLFVAGALALAVVLAGVGGSGVALAQGPTTTPTTPQQAPIHEAAQAFWQALANRLNVTLDTLTQAVRGAAKDVVAQAVTNGTLTQDQANTANSRIDQWQPGQGPSLPFFGERGRGGRGGKGDFGGPGHGGMMGGLDAAAKALNMTTADLMTELRSGKTLADNLVLTVSGDTIKNPFDRTGWPDAPPGNANILYVMSNGYLKPGWFGQISPTGRVNFDPRSGQAKTGVATQDSTSAAVAGVLHAVARGNDRLVRQFFTGEYGGVVSTQTS